MKPTSLPREKYYLGLCAALEKTLGEDAPQRDTSPALLPVFLTGYKGGFYFSLISLSPLSFVFPWSLESTYAFPCITRNRSLQKFTRKSWGLCTLLKSKKGATIVWNESGMPFFECPWKVRFFFPQSMTAQLTKPKAAEHWQVVVFATLCERLRSKPVC